MDGLSGRFTRSVFDLPKIDCIRPLRQRYEETMTAIDQDSEHSVGIGAGVSVRARVRIAISSGRHIATFCTFNGLPDRKEHIVLAFGELVASIPPLVRIHSECITGETFGSQHCDCGPQLQEAIERIAQVGGFVVYLRQEGRGIGLYAKLDAYGLQQCGFDTFEANRQLNFKEDLRDYSPAAMMLQALGVNQIRLLSNNPDKVSQLRRFGIKITEVIPTSVFANPYNRRYLRTKKQKAAHTLDSLG
jgi:GTP cyclohydrolase II